MNTCIFCKIANHQIPSEIVYEDDLVCAFKDINPTAPLHILIVPKKHISDVLMLTEEDKELIGHIFLICSKLSKQFNVDANGFRIVNNCGKDGGQTVNHIHFHLLGGRKFSWPAG